MALITSGCAPFRGHLAVPQSSPVYQASTVDGEGCLEPLLHLLRTTAGDPSLCLMSDPNLKVGPSDWHAVVEHICSTM